MALSTLSRAIRPSCLLARSSLFCRSVPMATSAEQEMKAYWEKNQRLGRPNSPWLIYSWPVSMASSFAHRVTGVGLGVTLYGAAITMAIAPNDFAYYVGMLKAWELGPAVWVPIKIFCSFPVLYHCMSGVRHLFWDYVGGYEVQQQNKSAALIWGTAITASVLLSLAAYM